MRYIFLAILLLSPLSASALDIDVDSNSATDIAYGGTNATTESAARTNLGLAIGTDVESKTVVDAKQERVTGECTAGSSIRVIAVDGTVTCETDDSGSGTVPSGTADGQMMIWDQTVTQAWVVVSELTDIGINLEGAYSNLVYSTGVDLVDPAAYGSGWNSSNQVPTQDSVYDKIEALGSGWVTSIIAGTGISVDQGTGDVTVTATGGSGASYVEQTGDPSAGDESEGTWIFATVSGDAFYQSQTGLYTFPGDYVTNSGSCSATPTIDFTEATNTITTSSRWAGNSTVSTTSIDVCSVEFEVDSIVGSITSKTYWVKVYSTDGTDTSDLVSLLGTKTFLGSSVTVGEMTVEFDSPVTTGTSGYAIVIGEDSPDASNNFLLKRGDANNDVDWRSTRWTSAGSYDTSYSAETTMRIYE